MVKLWFTTMNFCIQLVEQQDFHITVIYIGNNVLSLLPSSKFHCFRLDLNDFKWTEVYLCKGHDSNEPQGRYRHEVAFDGENILILGGGTAEVVFDFETIPTFNLTKQCWKSTKTLKDSNYGMLETFLH